jgi:site-specific recombinase XerD
MTLPPDPSLKDIQLIWEAQFWNKSRETYRLAANRYEVWMKFFGPDRKPRDIFRSDVAEYRAWLEKKGWKPGSITVEMERGKRLFKYLDERELVEKDFNPFAGMAPRRVRL